MTQRAQHVILLTILVFAVILLFTRDIPRKLYEDASFALSPTAARAYEYGDAHFRALNTRQYDVDRAEYWYDVAWKLDPMYPGVNHQRARISFLRGNYREAMKRINAEIALPSGPVTPSSYYIRGLIEGYMGEYAASAKDYERYLESDPHNWAAINDYAWVLLKGKRFQDAVDVTEKGLEYFPNNPWLLNSQATGLFELGRFEEALAQVRKAHQTVSSVTEQQWLTAYPGNDPKIAGEGLEAFRKAVANNMHTIEQKVLSSTVQ